MHGIQDYILIIALMTFAKGIDQQLYANRIHIQTKMKEEQTIGIKFLSGASSIFA